MYLSKFKLEIKIILLLATTNYTKYKQYFTYVVKVHTFSGPSKWNRQ